MSYPPPPDQSGQGGFQYDPYGNQPGSQPPSPQGGGYSPQPQQPGYPAQQPVGYGPPQMPPPYAAPMMGPQPKNGLGVTGMVTGIIGIVLFWCGLVGIILAILAVIFGGVGVARANRGEATNKGMAVTGVVLGVITLALAILGWIWWGSLVGAAATSTT